MQTGTACWMCVCSIVLAILCCYAMHCYAMHCYAMHCYAMHCYAMHCYAIHCYAMHCYAMRCYAMHCYAMRCYAMHCYSAWNSFKCKHAVAQCCTIHTGAETGHRNQGTEGSSGVEWDSLGLRTFSCLTCALSWSGTWPTIFEKCRNSSIQAHHLVRGGLPRWPVRRCYMFTLQQPTNWLEAAAVPGLIGR